MRIWIEAIYDDKKKVNKKYDKTGLIEFRLFIVLTIDLTQSSQKKNSLVSADQKQNLLDYFLGRGQVHDT